MPEHPLHHLDVGAGRDSQRDRCVPQCMCGDALKRRVCFLAACHRVGQPRGCRRRWPERCARLGRPQQLVAAFAFGCLGQCVDDERGQRDGAVRRAASWLEPPFMSENRRELPTTVGIVGIAKTVALHRLAMTRENHQKRPTGNLVFCRF
jgi:hypothetical protein